MLMVTTSVRMVDGIHGNTTSLGPRVALDGILMLGPRCLEERLVWSSTTCNNADHAAHAALQHLLRTGGELDTGLAFVWVVADDSDVVAAGASKSTTVSNLLLNVGYDGTFRDGSEREDVANSQSCILAGVDELSRVHALVRNEGLCSQLVAVWVSEDDFAEWCASAGIVENLLHYTANIAMSLSEVENSELRRRLIKTSVRGEDRAATLPLIPDNSSLKRILLATVVGNSMALRHQRNSW